MKVIVKGIGSGTCAIEVQATTTILDLKRQVATELNIPAAQQIMVLFGKPLQDDKTIGFYPKIQDGTKIFVAVKKTETLDTLLKKALKQFYTDQQCQIILEEFMKDFHTKVNSLSLDDLERLAKIEMDITE